MTNTKKVCIGQQGEVKIFKIAELPPDIGKTKPLEKDGEGRHIVSHSEKGHHHVLPADADVMERVKDVPTGMQIIYAIVKNPGELVQTAQVSHDGFSLDVGTYEFRISRMYNHFLKEARRVAD